MANKITKREVINMMLANAEVKANPVFVDYLTHELELLDKRAERKSDKPTKKQTENAGIMEIIKSVLACGEKMTIAEIKGADAALSDFSSQKISALLSQMNVDKGGIVHKDYDKKVPVFFIETETAEVDAE